MDIAESQKLFSLLLTVVELGVCALALARRVWRMVPLFTGYLVLVVLVDIARWAVAMQSGFGSRTYSWAYWMTQPLLLLARAAALADVFRAALGLYSGVWQLARYLLAGAATVLLALAAVRTTGTPGITSYVIYVERELEFSIAISLLLLLALSRYYGVALNRPLGGIAIGLAFYSSVVITSSSIMSGPVAMPWWVYSVARDVAYFASLGFWAWALRWPLRETAPPELATLASYERDSRMLSERMRALNARLVELMKR